MTSDSGTNRDTSCLFVPNFPQENDVRVLTQDTSQTTREGQSSFIIYLNLVDPFQSVLNRIFNSDDIFSYIIELTERCVESGCLSASRRTSQQDNAFWRLKNIFKELLVGWRESQLLFTKESCIPAQNPNNDFFTEYSRQD